MFDPLGLVAPFLLQGKAILQEMCREGKDWDEVPDVLRSRWERRRGEVCMLAKLKIPHCYKPDGFKEIKSVTLHHFSDTRMEGYGQCSYLRLIDTNSNVHSSLVMAKSRVAPLKPVTIPSLELTAAVVSVMSSTFLRKELEYEHIS